ncbi:hypothetical protein NE237_002282 [Protea cynaroides]|uniref:Uncharacterized protein n=1 Tax=Protea cynaroides TaxID=273540 RepID=A0A9Q0KVL3_9MAGN|nr:hypothetical protein NE237_002282 [Protea cynaroides]
MMIPSSRVLNKSKKRVENGGYHQSARMTFSSLLINIPNWSNILKEDYRDSHRRVNDGDHIFLLLFGLYFLFKKALVQRLQVFSIISRQTNERMKCGCSPKHFTFYFT